MSSHPFPQARVVRTAGQVIPPPPAPRSQEPSRLGGLLASAARVDYRRLLRVAFNRAVDLRSYSSVVLLYAVLMLLQMVMGRCLGPQYTHSQFVSPR